MIIVACDYEIKLMCILLALLVLCCLFYNNLFASFGHEIIYSPNYLIISLVDWLFGSNIDKFHIGWLEGIAPNAS